MQERALWKTVRLHAVCVLLESLSGKTRVPLSLSTAALSPLLEEGFEAKAFATATIQNQMVGDTLQKLANGIAALDKELYSQVEFIINF